MKKLLSLFLVLLMALSFGAVASAEEKPTQIIMGCWGDPEVEFSFNALAEKALEELNIELIEQRYPSDADFWNNLPAQIAAGTAPDFVNVSNELYLQYISNGLFVDLTPYIEDGTITCLDAIMDAPRQVWEVNGGMYGIPFTQTPASFIINMRLWEQAGLTEEDFPSTWDEVLDVCKVIKEKLDMPGLCFNTQEFHFTQYALSFGGGWGFGETIDTPENAAALQYIIDAYKEGYVVTPKELGLAYDGNVITSDQAVMSTGGTWVNTDAREADPDLKLTFLPVPNAEGVEASGTMHTATFVVLANGKNEAKTAKLINWMASSPILQEKQMFNGYVSAFADRYAEYADYNPQFASLLDRIELCSGFGYPAESKKFADALIFAMEDVLFNGVEKTGADIVAELQAQFAG